MKSMITFKGAAVSTQGSSHIRCDKPCQDRSAFVSEQTYSAVMVFDGHGSDRHFRSAMGAELAKEICLRELPEFAKAVSRIKTERSYKSYLKDFEKYLIFSWRDEIENELIINPISEEELAALNVADRKVVEEDPHVAFGSTMLVAIACSDQLFIIQLGDGDCRVEVKGSVISPVTVDESLKFGKTTSLCSSDAYSHIRDIILPLGAIDGVLLSTDGVLNSFDTEEHYSEFCVQLLKGMRDPESDMGCELGSFLPRLSSEGSGDDVSVAAMIKIVSESTDFPSKIKSQFFK